MLNCHKKNVLCLPTIIIYFKILKEQLELENWLRAQQFCNGFVYQTLYPATHVLKPTVFKQVKRNRF